MVVPRAMVLITVLILPSAVTCVQSALRRVCWARNTFRPKLKWMRLNARSTWILGRGAAPAAERGAAEARHAMSCQGSLSVARTFSYS